jgi:hypothetical protein
MLILISIYRTSMVSWSDQKDILQSKKQSINYKNEFSHTFIKLPDSILIKNPSKNFSFDSKMSRKY